MLDINSGEVECSFFNPTYLFVSKVIFVSSFRADLEKTNARKLEALSAKARTMSALTHG